MSAARSSKVDVMMSNAKHILREILKGLEALHNMELVHRDIKGVCVGGGGRVASEHDCVWERLRTFNGAEGPKANLVS